MKRGPVTAVALALALVAAVGWQVTRPAGPPAPAPGTAPPASAAGGVATGGAAAGAPAAGAPAAGATGGPPVNPAVTRAPGGPAPGPVPVEVVQVAASRVREDLQTVGSLRSNESVVLRPEVAGRIVKIGFRDGQTVRKGQLLVGLDDAVNQAEVAQARAELDLAALNLKRTADLASRNFVSSSAQDQANSSVQVLAAKLQLARARLDKMNLVAPFDGVVGIRGFSLGDYVKDGVDLVNLEDISRLKATFRLPERMISQLKVGQVVEVAPDALPDVQARGTIDAINPRIDDAGRSVEVRAVLPNADGRLRPGMFVRVRVVIGERTDALVVPEEAIVPAGSEFFAYRVVDGKALRVRVVPGARQGGTVEIASGLAAGDQVIVAGQVRLAGDGQPVRIVPAGAAAAAAAAGAGGVAR